MNNLLLAFDSSRTEMLTLFTDNWKYIGENCLKETEGSKIKLEHRLCTKLVNISGSIIEQLKRKNIYSAKILYRAFIEHYIKCQFIILNPRKISDISDKYHLFGSVEEYRSYQSSYQHLSQLDGIDKKDMWELIYAEFPELRNYSEKEIGDNIRLFAFKNMVLDLAKLFKNKVPNINHLENTMMHYWECSTFIHGGPTVEKLLYQSNDELNEDEQKDLKNLISIPVFDTFESICLVLMHSIQFNHNAKEIFVNIRIKLDELYALVI
jgi:hypothetical protein